MDLIAAIILPLLINDHLLCPRYCTMWRQRWIFFKLIYTPMEETKGKQVTIMLEYTKYNWTIS